MAAMPWEVAPLVKPFDHLANDLQFVVYEKKDGVAHIRMNRPDRLNALGEQMHDEMGQCWLNFKHDPGVRVAIVTGTGRAFCAGHDLKEVDERHRAGDYQNDTGQARSNEYAWGLAGPRQRWGIPDVHYNIEKPIIAAVNGVAMGLGWEMVCASDIAIASSEAMVGEGDLRAGHFGEPLELLLHLPKKVGMHLALTGKTLDAARANDLGLFSMVVPPEKLLATAEEVAKEILALPWDIVRAYKQYMIHGRWMHPEYAEQYKRLLSSASSRKAIWTEGPRAFAEKRKAEYQPGVPFKEFERKKR